MQHFGTDGIRGRYGSADFNADFITRFARSLGQWLHAQTPTPPHVIIGRDTRTSGLAIEALLVQQLLKDGIDTTTLGIVPTPAVALLSPSLQGDCGICLTASHNPASDNGIKCFNAHGLKISQTEEATLEHLLTQAPPPHNPQPLGTAHSVDGAQLYLQHYRKLLPPNSLQGLRVALDTAHGATFHTSPRLLQALGADIIHPQEPPNGTNINHQAGTEHPPYIQKLTRTAQATCGIAHDGDGDRTLICNAHGKILHGDRLLGILAQDLKTRNQLHRNTLAITHESNLGLDTSLKKLGISTLRVPIGDRHITQALLQHHLSLGGESSGHILFAQPTPIGDGLLTAIRYLQLLNTPHSPLPTYTHNITLLPQATYNLKVAHKRPLKACPHLQQATTTLQQALAPQGRLQARYSGTEALLRLRVEAPTQALATHYLTTLQQAAHKDLS